ncbi:MAG: PEP-CTERM sorting domain-containing protein, partial [Rhodoferax sp.]|nr:PEP-CTERM sorting domain-containing protein [Rhodoferax sp.]
MNFNRFPAAIALTVVSILFCAQANASTVTMTETGIIGSGFDTYGTFFNGIGTDLAGKTFTQSITFDPLLLSGQFNAAGSYQGSGLDNIPATLSININGITQVIDFTALSSQAQLRNGNTAGLGGNIGDAAQMEIGNGITFGSTRYNANVEAGLSVWTDPNDTTTKFGISLALNQSFAYRPLITDYQYAHAHVSGSDIANNKNIDYTFDVAGGAYSGSGSITGVYWNQSNLAPVPEPETYAMLLAGLGLLGA